jgi:putative tryptophan/tyrosine transport system substrate-binding protein
MRRRDFLTLVGSTTAWPLAARAQQPAMPMIGFLRPASAEPVVHLLTAFRQGLKEASYVEGQNVAIEYRWAEGRDDRLPEMAADLVRRQVAVILTPDNITAALAAKAATKTIPIVFTSGIDPVNSGLVSNFNRPSGNLTGIYDLSNDLAAKRLGMLHELVPNVPAVTLLVNPRDPIVAESTTKEVETAARALGLQLQILTASTNPDIDTAFATLVQHKAGALLVSPDAFFTSRRVQLATLAARHAIPTMYSIREYVQVGGLMSYGRNIADTWHRAGVYAGRLLKGEKPADLPIMLSTKFEFVINFTTAKALGLTFPPGLLALADEVID